MHFVHNLSISGTEVYMCIFFAGPTPTGRHSFSFLSLARRCSVTAAMDGVGSYTELLASVAGPGFASVAANDLGTAAAVVHSPCVDPVSYGGSHLGQIHRSSSSSGSDSLSSSGEEDYDPVAVSEEEDDAMLVEDPYNPAGSSWFSPCWEEDDVAVPVSEQYYPTPTGSDDFESHDVDQYCAASDTFASQMHNAAAPVEQDIKRKRNAKGKELPTCRPPSEVGAVEAALRASASKETAQIFYPKPGTVFDSLAEAYEFYNLFSWEVGFGVRYGRSNINKGNGYKTKQEIECGNAGSDKRCNNQSQRSECKALLKLLRTEDHGWYVSQIIEDHNHPLSECCGEKMQWRSHRTIDVYTRDMIRYLRENNVSLSKVHSILGSIYGGVKDLPFTKRSLRTICSQIARDQMDDDVKKTLEVFRKMRNEDPQFAFSVDVDGLNRVKTLIWTNSRSKMQYACFGDVVTFDTTFCTNIYRMPFGLFVGVNNHFQSTIFAGVLMRDETEKSFEWVFKEFLSLMGGKHPQTMLTDQCIAMGNTCGTVMSETLHLWCKWHVLRKAPESLGPVYSKKSEFRHQFHKILNEMLTIDEFEGAWEALLVKYSLRDNPFMTRIYECRRKWAKPFFFDKFCAKMLSTQKVESANHMLKTYVPRNSSMNRFVLQYNILLHDRGVEEDRQEHRTKQVHKISKRAWPIQRHAEKIYTRAVYKLFTDEVDKVTHYRVFPIVENSVYEVHHIYAERRESWSRVVFKITVGESHSSFDCECGQYTHFGILCCHAIAVIVNLGLPHIPEAHIMKRWTRNARDVLPPHLVMYQKDTPAIQSRTFRHSLLYTNAMESVKIGDTNLDTFKKLST
ncbi:hypothetical protein QYE76_071278 [Lolium multiflorum]|uniref:Protein FAR1-RELATED SEQUENCE n=1 Tax=Lolium multiflorum TaxID=4521 RepID=A0AAD8SLD4_LOLMU|nr:hypothetical protein QYE76_071278 [Lolium multiflorum]